MSPLISLLMDLVLFCSNKGSLVHVGMDLNVGIVREFQGIPFAVVNRHCETLAGGSEAQAFQLQAKTGFCTQGPSISMSCRRNTRFRGGVIDALALRS